MRSERSYQPLTPRFHPLIHKLQFLYKKIYNRFIPVSYTHLDVYKRQTLGHPLSACVGFLCKSAIKVLSFSSLLSHTFLEDVYKRQTPSASRIYITAINGTSFSVTWPIRLIPPSRISAIRAASTIPVSYTHLDVYKRQSIYSPFL